MLALAPEPTSQASRDINASTNYPSEILSPASPTLIPNNQHHITKRRKLDSLRLANIRPTSTFTPFQLQHSTTESSELPLSVAAQPPAVLPLLPECTTTTNPVNLNHPQVILGFVKATTEISNYIELLAEFEQKARFQQVGNYMLPNSTIRVPDLLINTIEPFNNRSDKKFAFLPTFANKTASEHTNTCGNIDSPPLIDLQTTPPENYFPTQLYHQQYQDLCISRLARGDKNAELVWRTQVPQMAIKSCMLSDALAAFTMLIMSQSRALDSCLLLKQSTECYKRCVSVLLETPVPHTDLVEEVLVCTVLLANYVLLQPNVVTLVTDQKNGIDFFGILRAPFYPCLHASLEKQDSKLAVILGSSLTLECPQDYTIRYLDILTDLIDVVERGDSISKSKACGPFGFIPSSVEPATPLPQDEVSIYRDTITCLRSALYCSINHSPIFLLHAFSGISEPYLDVLRAQRPVALVVAAYILIICIIGESTTSRISEVSEQDVRLYDDLLRLLKDNLAGDELAACLYWPQKVMEKVTSKTSNSRTLILRYLLPGL